MTSTTIAERGPRSDRAFYGLAALLFAGSASVTIAWCSSMSAMGSMPMPGGWTMSMTWMRSPGQTWLGAAATFLGMWTVMMVAMMLPSLVPMLSRYRQSLSTERTVDRLTAIAALAYFAVWASFGLIVFALGSAIATIAMQQPAVSRLVPFAAGVAVVIAGALQFTAWKRSYLRCCRAPIVDETSAWRHGLSLGMQCGYCCANLMTVLAVIGMMDLRAMTLIAAAVTIERVAPRGETAARIIGAAVIVTGLLLIALTRG